MTRRRPAIALLLDGLNSEYTVQLRRAAERAAAQRDVDLLVVAGQRLGAPSVIEATQNRAYELIASNRVDGVIVIASTLGHYCGPSGIVALCRSYAPLPVCSVGIALEGVHSVVIDNEGGMGTAVGHLIDAHRCSRIAFIAAQPNSIESNERLAGYCKAHADRGVAVDPQLIAHGEFTMSSGANAMRTLLERGLAFDAVVAANDDMALGAMDVLEGRGLKIPRDVLVCGFDDINSAHYARPSLSTLRQPTWWVGSEALETVLRLSAGETLPWRRAGAVEFVRRESCGCGSQVTMTLPPIEQGAPSVRDALRILRGDLERRMREAVAVPTDMRGDWSSILLDALDQDLSGQQGQFLSVFQEILDQAQAQGASLDEFQRLVSTLRAELRRMRVSDLEGTKNVERLWHGARVLVGAASIRALGRNRMDAEHAALMLGTSGERFAATLSLPLLKKALIEELPRLQIQRAAVSLYGDRFSKDLEPLLVMVDGQEVPDSGEPLHETALAPDAAFRSEECQHSVVVPLTFEAEHLGVAVFGSGAVPGVYESLRQQIGSAIKGALLHRQVVAQVAARERLERQRLTEESRLASEIQTNMKPPCLDIPGLELASLMIPAAEAGGDYYDVLPTRGGGWLTIGDVTGHGLGAGLIMLMLQSMIAALVRSQEELPPSRIVAVVNEAIYDNVRQRLQRDDHATLVILRYFQDGSIRFAGAHDEFVVWRAATGRCETVAPTGFWVGAIPSITRLTRDDELKLAPGDVLVLYTDGVTEARNAQNEQFGLERVVALVEAMPRQPVGSIRDRIVDEVKRWSSRIDDDVTLVVARHHG